ncbi:DUF3365 domain-containing protein [Echinicola jeungdonensis]|uniref:DUF3365 domain-containing protein n=1 Tax=Echinicola jeungdonensis TaxID=709343 RepID=A0ABV5J6K6_9BACT|nr:DUF3365 domain-containing protein [Echinicola jeungdonensis]MDN3669307.1 DUF3365 domain-containing protein [Echinicola jeungdonensis]
MKIYFNLISLVFFLWACNSGKKVEKEVLEEVNQSMEIKKVSEAEILNESLKWGNEIAEEAQKELMSALQKAIADKGVSGAIEYCNAQAFPLVEKVGEKHGVEVSRVSHNYRNPADQPNEMEAMLLDAYEYNEENGIESKPNIQEIDGGEVLLYTKAIKIPGGLCLNCHGEPGKDISAETLMKLDELYPKDKAKGHKVGDLRGIWSIAIPKKEVVKRL